MLALPALELALLLPEPALLPPAPGAPFAESLPFGALPVPASGSPAGGSSVEPVAPLPSPLVVAPPVRIAMSAHW